MTSDDARRSLPRWRGLASHLLTSLGFSIATICATTPAVGQYNLDWFTVDGGGASGLTGGSFALSGTIGQPDAGVLTGGGFVLQGGFWQGGVVVTGIHDDGPGTMELPLVDRLYRATHGDRLRSCAGWRGAPRRVRRARSAREHPLCRQPAGGSSRARLERNRPDGGGGRERRLRRDDRRR
jgi:hypothetical protein